MFEDDLSAPGAVLANPGYQDLCAFFATFPPAQSRDPRFGDWVTWPPSDQPSLVLSYDPATDQLTVTDRRGELPLLRPRAGSIWLPTLDQLCRLMRDEFGTSGFFTSSFNGSTYWFSGQLLGMTVTNMQPLAEGSSPEEAALKALLMRHQR